MKFPRILLSLPILFGLACSGCVNNPSIPVAEDRTNIYTIIGSDYRNRGKIPFESIEDKFTSATGCEVAYIYYRPRDVSNDVLVVLGHGFMRSKKRMTHLVQHLASWGLSVVNVEFCNSKLWAGNHDRNGADMVAVVILNFQWTESVHLCAAKAKSASAAKRSSKRSWDLRLRSCYGRPVSTQMAKPGGSIVN